jgi:hypothetical protein
VTAAPGIMRPLIKRPLPEQSRSPNQNPAGDGGVFGFGSRTGESGAAGLVRRRRPQRKLLAPTFSPSASTSAPRQEHQVGRFLGVFEERPARRADPRTHGQATSKIHDLARAGGYGKVRRDFAFSVLGGPRSAAIEALRLH